MSLVAGIDAGTQSIKRVIYDAARNQLVATTSAPLKIHQWHSTHSTHWKTVS